MGAAAGGLIPEAVILARGLGTRMRRADGSAELAAEQAEAADGGLKAFMPVGRPFIDYILSELADAGVTRAWIVVGPHHDAARRHFADAPAGRVQVGFAVQARPLGTADAMLAARRSVESERFLVVNGDNLYPATILARLATMEEPAVAAFRRSVLTGEGGIPADRIDRFALLEADRDGYLRRILEKPDAAGHAGLGQEAGVSMNCWLFDRRIFAACGRVRPSARGELELPLAVQEAVDTGAMRVRVVPAEEPVLDLSARNDVAAMTQRLNGRTPRP